MEQTALIEERVSRIQHSDRRVFKFIEDFEAGILDNEISKEDFLAQLDSEIKYNAVGVDYKKGHDICLNEEYNG
jgi:hypothetical protein